VVAWRVFDLENDQEKTQKAVSYLSQQMASEALLHASFQGSREISTILKQAELNILNND